MLSRTKLACAVSLTLIAGVAQSAAWSDASIGLTYGTKFKEPGNAAEVKKSIVTLQYVGGFKYGVNFFTLDMLKSDVNNPARNSPRGAQEVYVVYSNTLSLGKLGGSPVKFGPVRDVAWQTGFDFNSKNDAFGAGLVKLIAGPKIEFDVPGLLTLGLLYYKENNNNSFAGKNVHFDGTARLAAVWSFPFQAGTPAVFKGFANFTGAKGLDGGGAQTSPETWLDSAVLWDIGSVAGTPKTFYAGIGYQYIKHKFGNRASLPGTKVSAPELKFEAHF
jgi:nucleoside-specific outer membrane channel protein Tsx